MELNYNSLYFNNQNILYNNYTGLFYSVNVELLDELLKFKNDNSMMDADLADYLDCLYFFGLKKTDLKNLRFILNKEVIFNDKNAYIINDGNYTVIPLDNTSLDFLKLSLDSSDNTLQFFFESLGVSFDSFCRTLLLLTNYKNRIAKIFTTDNMIDAPFYFNFSFKKYLEIERDANYLETDNNSYYQAIESPYEQFKSKETTISYMLRNCSDILQNDNYGLRLIKSLMNERIYKHIDILEIGAGLGDVAYSICKYLNELNIDYSYTICELSSKMLDWQKDKLKAISNNVYFYNCDALSFSNGKYDFIISNEMIADLPSIKFKDLKKNDYKFRNYNFSKELFSNYHEGYVNVGALILLDNIKKMSKKNTITFISEHFELANYIYISKYMKDHDEVPIDFELLERYSKSIGMNANIFSLKSYFNINDDTEVLSDYSLFVFMRKYRLSKMFYTKKLIGNLGIHNIYNLNYTNIDTYLRYFKVLILTRVS